MRYNLWTVFFKCGAGCSTFSSFSSCIQVNDSYIKVDETHKLIIMSLVVNAATNRATALDLGDKMIRLFSANAVDAGSGTTMPSGRNYGSLFDEYTISLGIAPSHAIEDQSRWIYSGTIRPGTHRM